MTPRFFRGLDASAGADSQGVHRAKEAGLMMSSGHPARARLKNLRSGLIAFGISACFTAEAAPPPLPPPLPPPPLPAAAQPGGAQPVMPPPTIPIPETNLDLSVPPVYERPLGAEEGERVFVKRFVITGVV